MSKEKMKELRIKEIEKELDEILKEEINNYAIRSIVDSVDKNDPMYDKILDKWKE